MIIRSRLACAVLTFVLAGSVALRAQSEESPRSFECEFKTGQSTTYEGGSFSSKVAQPLAFTIEKIDLEAQKAVLKTSEGEGGRLSVVRAINANHFIEAVQEGFLNLTTIYDMDPAASTYPAAHSRHFGFLGQPVIAQYTGLCRAR